MQEDHSNTSLGLARRSYGNPKPEVVKKGLICTKLARGERRPRKPGAVRLWSLPSPPFPRNGTEGFFGGTAAQARVRGGCAFIWTLAGADGRITLVSEEKGAS